MVAVPDLDGSATLAAVMVTVCEALMPEGAVYNPFERVPSEGLMDHVTPVTTLPVTVAVSWVLCEELSVALGGVTLTLIPLGTS